MLRSTLTIPLSFPSIKMVDKTSAVVDISRTTPKEMDDSSSFGAEATDQHCWLKSFLKITSFITNTDPFYILNVSSRREDSKGRGSSELCMQESAAERCNRYVVVWQVVSMIYTLVTSLREYSGYHRIFYTKSADYRKQNGTVTDVIVTSLFCINSFSFLSLVMMPKYYQSRPMNFATIRYLLDSRRETSRLDSVTLDKIAQMTASVCSYQQSLFENSQNRKLYLDREKWTKSEESKRMLASFKSKVYLLRPHLYKAACYRETLLDSKRIALAVIIYRTCNTLASYLSWTKVYLEVGRCRWFVDTVNHCDQINATRGEILFFTKMAAVYWLDSILLMHYMVLYLLEARHQLKLVGEIRQEMTNGLQRLRMSTGSRDLDGYVNEILLKLLVKFRVAIEEIKRGARCMTEMLIMLSFLGGPIIMAYVFTNNMTTIASISCKNSIINTYWLTLNGLAFVSAFNLAKFVKLERLIWSMMAEIIVWRKDRYLVDDFASNAWHKFAIYFGNNLHVYEVRPYFVTMTHRNIIAVNFYIISLIALLKSSKFE